jgi:hypothetical protein
LVEKNLECGEEGVEDNAQVDAPACTRLDHLSRKSTGAASAKARAESGERERTYEGEAPLEQVRDDTKEDHEDLNERPGDDDGDEGCSLRGRAEEA